MRRAIFLDRDGTVNRDAHYLKHPDDVEILPNTIEGLRKLQNKFLLIIVTNQSGIGRGYFTEKRLLKINKRLITMLSKQGVKITKIYYAPYHKDSKIPKYRKGEFLRKPNPGMILKAANEFNIELSASWIIGDKDSDIGAGINAGLKGCIYIKNKREDLKYKPTKIVKNVDEAAKWILKKEGEARVYTDYNEIGQVVEQLRAKGKKIVTTNGVFDILHIGHLRYLAEAKKYGNILVVGINCDDSVKELKGEERPIIPQFARAEMVANLKPVDYVVIFKERDPRKFLKFIKPDFHIKGGDYKMEQIIERDVVKKYGGEVVLIPMIKGYSTTNIIRKSKFRV